jgi:hypothetical protein
MIDRVTSWYHGGLFLPPPPCMLNKQFYSIVRYQSVPSDVHALKNVTVLKVILSFYQL